MTFPPFVGEARSTSTHLPVALARAPSAPAAVIVLPCELGAGPSTLGYAALLRERGCTVAVPDWARRPAAAGAALADPEAVAHVAAVRVLVGDAPRVFVVGFGAGGLHARLAACAIRGLAGVVEFCGQVVYPAISAERPMQPLDLLPGLRCPLQAHFGAEDVVSPPAHVAELEARLRARPVATQVFRYPGARRGFMDPADPAWAPEAAQLAWVRAVHFLDALTRG